MRVPSARRGLHGFVGVIGYLTRAWRGHQSAEELAAERPMSGSLLWRLGEPCDRDAEDISSSPRASSREARGCHRHGHIGCVGEYA